MRATDRRRDRTVAALGDGYSAGAIGTNTFELRVDAALRARTVRELRRLVADLPSRWRALLRARPEPPSVRIAAPPDGPGPWVLGRSPSCPLVLAHDTVSRQHAQLRRLPDDRFEVLDLGSTNGTRVNGWRVERAVLRPGDVLQLGELRVEIV